MIAVVGGKGGSGKTTTTLGLARALVDRKQAGGVVAIDADWDLPNLASLAVEVGIGPQPASTSDPTAVPTVTEALRMSGRPLKMEQEHGVPEPRVLRAPTAPDDREVSTALSGVERATSESTVLVDCPAGASPDAVAPLRVADRCLIVTSLGRAALRDAAKTAAMARTLGCPPAGVVVTRARSAPDRLADLLECPVLGAVPSAPPTPLSTDRVERAYADVATSLDEPSRRVVGSPLTDQ